MHHHPMDENNLASQSMQYHIKITHESVKCKSLSQGKIQKNQSSYQQELTIFTAFKAYPTEENVSTNHSDHE